MARRKSQLLAGIAAAVLLAVGAVRLWLPAGGGAAAAPEGGAAAVPASSASVDPGSGAGAGGAREATPASPVAAARPAPDEGPEGEAWRKAKVAFQLRELGRMAPYVKTALDDARRDMAFCFRRAARTDEGPPAPERDAPPRPQAAVLLLYLEAREGALDVVDTRTDYLGDASPELVECCREVLRGLEIPAFGAAPGQRYRLKLRLE